MTNTVSVPTFDALMNPLLAALVDLGGSGTVDEIFNKVVEIAGLTDQQLQVPHGKKSFSEVAYRLAWSRSWLKKAGLLENSTRGVWSLTSVGKTASPVDTREILRIVRSFYKDDVSGALREDVALLEHSATLVEEIEAQVEPAWQEKLIEAVMETSPAAFERLTQRMLRESGFIQVEVTGRSGDGGIDGKGILRLGGFLSFQVIFQCKKYRETVGAAAIRDFRGAMVGRADKGLLITTGTFTKDARREATRDGAPAIDLVDGQQLADRLKDLGLGVMTRQVEEVFVDSDWFASV